MESSYNDIDQTLYSKAHKDLPLSVLDLDEEEHEVYTTSPHESQ